MSGNRSDPPLGLNHQGTRQPSHYATWDGTARQAPSESPQARRLRSQGPRVPVSWWFTALLCLLAVLAMVAGRPPRLAPSANSAFRTPHSALAVSYARLPLSFEVNQGQTDESVKFVSRGSGYTLFLTGTEAVLQLRNADFGLRNANSANPQGEARNPQSEIRNPQLK